MLTSAAIRFYFEEINEELRKHGQRGEIGIVGGAVMCLVFNARLSTRDVDAIFEPSALIRRAAQLVAKRNDLPEDWLNDAAKGYLNNKVPRMSVQTFSNLNIWAPEPRYLLAMKCLSARWDSFDKDDVIFLLKHLRITQASTVFALLKDYYPKQHIPAKTQFFIEELFSDN